MEDFICVTVDGVEILELDCEDDETYRLSALSSLTGCDAVGLRYKNDSTGNYRGVKISAEGELMEPRGGWGSRLYTVVTKDAGAGSQFLDSSYSQPPSSDDPFTAMSSAYNDGVKAVSKSEFPVTREKPTTLVQGQEEVSKKELKARIKNGSLVARRALSQWNKLNTTIRGVVGATEFHGSGGLSKCEGTSQEQALQNQAIRKTITEREDVKSLYEVFVLEDRNGRVTIDHMKAGEHVRTVLNNRKRQLPGDDIPPPTPLPPQEDSNHGSSNEDQPSTRKACQISTVTKRPQGSKKRKVCTSNGEEKVDTDEKNETDEPEPESSPERSEYELNRASNIKKNLAMLNSLGLTTKLLEDGDAMLVARTWFMDSHGKRLRLAHVLEEAQDLGLVHTPHEKTFRGALIMFGNELVKEQLVELTKDGGLAKENIMLVGK